MAATDPAGAEGRPVPLEVEIVEEFLRSTPLFKACDPSVVGKVAPHAEALEFRAGATIVRAGAPADAMGILFRGKARVLSVNAATGVSVPLESLRPGDHYGEMGPLLGAAHPHAVVADEACVVLRLRADVVETLGTRVPGFSHAIARRLATRFVQLGVVGLRLGGGEGDGPRSMPSGPGSLSPGAAAAPPAGPAPQLPPGVVPFVEVADYDPQPKVLSMVPERLVLQHRLLPLAVRGTKLTVGMVSPRDQAAVQELRRVLHSVDVEPVAIGLDDFAQAIVRLKLHKPADAAKAAGQVVPADQLAFDVTDSEREADKAVRVIGDEVVRCVNRIVAAGLEREASDVHIEPEPNGVKVRFRVNGLLGDWNEYVPVAFAKGIVARLKILSGLDITERRLPQDGRIGLMVGRREVDLRISTLPASRGEKVVLRVFEAAGMMRPLDKVFAEPAALASVRQAVARTSGAVVVAGGTGSGKSSTLYSVLSERRKVRPDANVVMVEDPIEYRLPGVTQVQVNAAVGLGFPQVLRAILRQDPDVIALGETRDADTAKLALESAMTGHLLLTSIHAADAISVVQRLETLGCPRPLVAQSLSLVVVQRLVRRLCPSCCRMEPPAPVLLESLAARKLVERGAQVSLPRPGGCDLCGQTGFAGRVAVVETLEVDGEVRDALMTGQSLADIERVATASKALRPFHACATYLMARKVVGASDALLAVAG